ncbi:biotin transporter BioY [Marinitenerispora sediminis]|uniref:Biotin transporter BioY n=2 Tax=Marinitenerispora sediminis TaxID=1931232 RepID=A0A368SY29_9ACTN|nr:biotin transporter BioY [Marinitenerispora sediminis]RCV48706.1 biotin transporter BioY [Marinitenerispora sediminis]RCV52027.1 biotin transporter BioY [Marinitenerispora sediminis]
MPFAIPVGPVPITLQGLAVMLAPSLLGAKRGTLAVVTFLVLTAAGLPLLPGGRGGIAPFLGPTGGYMLGWIAGALVIGLLTDRMLPKYRFWPGLACNVLGGIAVVYLVGVPWSAVVLGDGMLATVVGAFLFLPGDLAKAVVAALVAAGVHRAYPIPPAGRRVDLPESTGGADGARDGDAGTGPDSGSPRPPK